MTTEPAAGVSDGLVGVSDVVRRVVAARVHDAQRVEDLTQETLVRVAASQGSLTGDALRAYAIVTARNVVIGQARSDAVAGRHAHRLVEFSSFDGPESQLLEREETDALAVGLERIDADDRQLLLRHEAEGVAIEVLAAEGDTSIGAIKMRLARARAVLRVEFLLAFRGVELPTPGCRPVLLALSAGDRRRQRALHATRHLLGCPTCAALARPVSERRRGLAVWLVVPVAEFVRRAWQALRHDRRAQAGAVAAVVAVVGLGAVGVVRSRADDDDRAAVATTPVTPLAVPETASAPVTVAAPSATPAAVAPATTATVVAPTTAQPAPPAAPCQSALPLDQLDPATGIGCRTAPTTVTVTEVPSDEWFWAATGGGRTVWVQLTGVGESPLDIDAGDDVVVAGVISDVAALDPAAVETRVVDAGYFLQATFDDIAEL